MPLLLDKFLTAMSYPLGLGLALLVVAFLLLARGKRKTVSAAILVTLVMLWAASMPITA